MTKGIITGAGAALLAAGVIFVLTWPVKVANSQDERIDDNQSRIAAVEQQLGEERRSNKERYESLADSLDRIEDYLLYGKRPDAAGPPVASAREEEDE